MCILWIHIILALNSFVIANLYQIKFLNNQNTNDCVLFLLLFIIAKEKKRKENEYHQKSKLGKFCKGTYARMHSTELSMQQKVGVYLDVPYIKLKTLLFFYLFLTTCLQKLLFC